MLFLTHWHRRGHTRRSLGAAWYRRTGRAGTVAEQARQEGDRIRGIDQGSKPGKEPRQRRIIEAEQPRLVHQLPHQDPPPMHSLPLGVALLYLHLLEAGAIRVELGAGAHFRLGQSFRARHATSLAVGRLLTNTGASIARCHGRHQSAQACPSSRAWTLRRKVEGRERAWRWTMMPTSPRSSSP